MSEQIDTDGPDTDGAATRDHPQTIKGEGDARGSDAPAIGGGAEAGGEDQAATDESGASAGGGAASSSEQASPLGDAHSQLSEGDAEAVRRHAGGGRSLGDSIGSSAGLEVGSGTPGDTGDLGGGDPQKVG
jgi:hypothetical protein